MTKFKRYVKRQSRRAWKAIKKFTGDRYGRGANQIIRKGIPQMVKDINMLKSVINSEKLRINLSSSATSPSSIGQINGNAPGYQVLDITPNPTQGDGYNNRTGSSIRLHSSNIKFMFHQQASTMSPLRFRIELYEVVGNTNTTLGAVSEIYSANPFTGMIDYNSSRNPDYFKDYKLLRTRRFTMPLDPASVSAQTMVKDVRIGMKYRSRHVRWDKNTSVVTSGQLIMVILCDTGNASNGTAPTISPYNSATVPIQGINTGALMSYYIDHYYYDN